MIACTICTTTVAIVAGSAGALALVVRMYWARIRHVFKAKSDTCDCCKHKEGGREVKKVWPDVLWLTANGTYYVEVDGVRRLPTAQELKDRAIIEEGLKRTAKGVEL